MAALVVGLRDRLRKQRQRRAGAEQPVGVRLRPPGHDAVLARPVRPALGHAPSRGSGRRQPRPLHGVPEQRGLRPVEDQGAPDLRRHRRHRRQADAFDRGLGQGDRGRRHHDRDDARRQDRRQVALDPFARRVRRHTRKASVRPASREQQLPVASRVRAMGLRLADRDERADAGCDGASGPAARALPHGAGPGSPSGLRRPVAAVQRGLPGRREHPGLAGAHAGREARGGVACAHGGQSVAGDPRAGLLPPVRERLQPREPRQRRLDPLGRAVPRRPRARAGVAASTRRRLAAASACS